MRTSSDHAPAIRVHGLGKRYHLGPAPTTIREAITTGLSGRLTRAGRAARRGEEFWALQDVSFELGEGEVLGVVGRNGAGKSTLLKILSRITEPTTGEAILHGRVASLLEVGTGFHPDLTGRENVYLNGSILGMSRREIEASFDEIVAFSEVERFVDTPVKRYSSGMYVRLAFSVAAHLRSEILIVDEVLAVGDTAFVRKCLGKIGEVATSGRTVLFVSHNMSTVERLCTTALLLTHGRVTAAGQPAHVVSDYLGGASTGELEWFRLDPAAGPVHIDSVRVTGLDGGALDVVTTDSDALVEVTYTVHRAQPDLILGVGINDAHDEPILGTTPADDDQTTPADPGVHRLAVELPRGVFLGRTYGIRVALYTPLGGVLDSVDDIRFQVEETAAFSNATPGGRPGVLALRLPWRVESG